MLKFNLPKLIWPGDDFFSEDHSYLGVGASEQRGEFQRRERDSVLRRRGAIHGHAYRAEHPAGIQRDEPAKSGTFLR